MKPGNEIPNAAAVLDALKPSCSYPFKYLCGCGVAFKLIQALALSEPMRSKLGEDAPKHLLDYLQYVRWRLLQTSFRLSMKTVLWLNGIGAY